MIGFRLDANEQIATGHMMRCLAIAKECRKLGQECLFLLAEDKETARLRQQGFRYCILHTVWDKLQQELPVLSDVIRSERLEYLVVDTYQATPGYLKALNKLTPVLYLDDMAQALYETDAVLHYGLCPDLDDYIHRYQTRETVVLAGMDYIPLREEFQPDTAYTVGVSHEGAVSSEAASGEHAARPRRILLTTGGTDPYDVTGKILRACEGNPLFHTYGFDVVVGSMNRHADALALFADGREQICLHQNVRTMGRLMRGAQMAVSAGGTTLYELCACGTPTVCFSFAENQRGGAAEMGRENIMPYAGDARWDDVAEAVVRQLADWIQHPAVCGQYGERMQQLVDGRGAIRIARFICSRMQ